MVKGNEITFLAEDEAVYPQLRRLYLDFDFRVFATGESGQQRRYFVTYKNLHDRHAIAVTPAFDSLRELESHSDRNIIQILRDSLLSSSRPSDD